MRKLQSRENETRWVHERERERERDREEERKRGREGERERGETIYALKSLLLRPNWGKIGQGCK